MFQHFQRGCRESIKNRNVKQNVQIKESYYIRKLKNEQKLIFESIMMPIYDYMTCYFRKQSYMIECSLHLKFD